VLGIGFLGNSALAQNADAEALFDQGNKLMAEGKLTQACDSFEASNRIEPRAGTLIRLGECREQNQQLASAWSAYKDALTRATDPGKRKRATDNIAAIEPRLSYLTVAVSDGDRIEGLTLIRNGRPFDPLLWNRSLPVDGGDHVIAAAAPDHQDWQTVVHIAAADGKVNVEVPRLVPLPRPMARPASPDAPRVAPATQSLPAHETTGSPGGFTWRRKIAIGVASASLVAVSAGAVFGTMSNANQDDAFKLCPDPAMSCPRATQANDFIRSSHSHALEANVAFGVAASTAILASVLWFAGAPDEHGLTRVSVIAAQNQPSVAVTGRF
jgi:hypothetical protein